MLKYLKNKKGGKKEMKKIFLNILIFLIFLSTKTYAFLEGAEQIGFLPLEVGARALGMGGAYCAIAEDASASYWNPAGLAQIKQREFSFMNANLSEDRKYNYIGIVNPSSSGVFALSYAPFKIGNIEGYDNEGKPLGSMDYKYTGFLFSYAIFEKPGITTGINIGYFRESCPVGKGKVWGIDLGMLYEIPKVTSPFDSAKAGIVIQNITGSKIKYDTGTKEKIPTNFKIGIAGRLFEEKLVLALDYSEKEGTRFGAEYWIRDIIGVRAGTYEGNKTYGASFKVQNYQFDYAYVEEDLDNGQRISFTVRF